MESTKNKILKTVKQFILGNSDLNIGRKICILNGHQIFLATWLSSKVKRDKVPFEGSKVTSIRCVYSSNDSELIIALLTFFEWWRVEVESRKIRLVLFFS